jgi:hypothetical protein
MCTNDHALRWQGFWLPKRGNRPEEYEDAFAGDLVLGRFAIADGASESAFAAEWARLLVEGFVRTPPGRVGEWLAGLRVQWHQQLRGREMPWYAEVKFAEGAFATVLGVSFGRVQSDRSRRWLAWAVGDSCLFQVRGDELLVRFPLTHADEFGNRPDLLCSRSRGNRKIKETLARGEWHDGDCLMLMSDALAQWFLEQEEAGHQPSNIVEKRATTDGFEPWIEGMRDARELRNDDVTLVIIDSQTQASLLPSDRGEGDAP